MRARAVQVAGIHDEAEAALLVDCGVDFLGFPFRLDFHREDCTDFEAARIIASLPSGVETVLITYLDVASEIASLAAALGVGWVQLHGPIEPAVVAELRDRSPGLRIARSLVVQGDNLSSLVMEGERHCGHVDAFLTDTYDPVTGASGATGRSHDWAVSRALAARLARPLVLAGGLTPDNVAKAIHAVRPAAVDVHTGVEGPDGRKDAELVTRFVARARAAFEQIGSEMKLG